jgi:peptidoglycan/LPS O-acetylase OafA/YrhL
LPLTHLPQLDGLRAVAVMFVMAFHFIPGVDRFAPLGSIGVRLFFVLSGFLITRLLLDARGRPLGPALRAFYIRRGLRIFPVFYLVLALAALLGIRPVRETWGWHVGYLTNAYLYLRGDWHGSISHLWSLAVEEQFYLVWPWLVLLTPAPRLAAAIVAMIVLAPLSRMAIGGPMQSVLPTSCLDSLGAGALLALPAARAAVMRAGAALGAPLLVAALALRLTGRSGVGLDVALDFGVSLTSAWVIGLAAQGLGGASGEFLSARPVIYLGTISYGVYLYHGFVPYAVGRLWPGMVDAAWPVRAVVLVTVTVAVASASWHLFERFWLAWKERLAPRVSQEPVHHVRVHVA